HDEFVNCSVVGRQNITVDQEKCDGCHSSGALVAVHERMIPRDAESISGSKLINRRFAVSGLVLSPRKSRFEGIFIPYAICTTVAPQLLCVHRLDGAPNQELPAHSASF